MVCPDKDHYIQMPGQVSTGSCMCIFECVEVGGLCEGGKIYMCMWVQVS